MVEDSTSNRTWASLYLHCSTLAKWHTHQCHDSSETLHQLLHFGYSVMFDSLWPHGLQHTRLPCPSPTPGVYSNSCPLSRWCHPTISYSVVPFSFYFQPLPVSGSFPMCQFFTSGGFSFRSVLPMNIQDWFPLGWTGLISLLSKGCSRVFTNTQFKSINSPALSFLDSTTLASIHDHRKNHSLD